MADEEVTGYVEIPDFDKCCEKFGIEPEDITTDYLQNLFESNVNTLNNTMFSFLTTSTAEDRDKERFKLLERFKIVADRSKWDVTVKMYEEVGLMMKELLILRGYLQQMTDVGVITVHHNTMLNDKLETLRLNMTIKDFSKDVDRQMLEATLKPKEVKKIEPEEQEEPEEEEGELVVEEKEEDTTEMEEKMYKVIEKSMPSGITYPKLLKKTKIDTKLFKKIKNKLILDGRIEKNGTIFQVVR